MKRGLLLDFGGVVLRTPFEMWDRVEAHYGLTPGTIPWRGPFDPATDELWQAFQRGETTERGYWSLRAPAVGALAGIEDLTYHEMFEPTYDNSGPDGETSLVRPQMRAFIEEVRKEGFDVAVLTNDMRAFHGDEWMARMSILSLFDSIVDGSNTGILKPDPRAYQFGCEAMKRTPDTVVFVDDLPVNINGAVASGLHTVPFDVTNVEATIARIWTLLRG